MFRKIVSNLAFSPALVSQLSFYARRLKKEELTRRLGLIFTALALVVQSLAVFSPPEAANASSSADFVRGGVSSVSDFLNYYDRNSNNIKNVYNSLGITRAEIAAAKKTTIDESSRYNWSMTSLYSHAQGQRSWDYGSGKVFYRPMKLTQQGGDKHPVYYSHSKTQGWFAIKIDCGNLITSKPPVKPPKEEPPMPTPSATCQAVGVTITNRTLVEMRGSAVVSGGAKISKYTFVVTDSTGKTVKTATVNSSQTTVGADSFELGSPGTYKVALTVATSLGNKTNASSCVKNLTIAKPEVCPYNPQLPPNSPDCQPCPENPDVWIKDERCKADVINTKSGLNLTQGNISASTTTAKSGDKISYTVTAKNQGIVSQKTTIKEELKDVLEYATLIDTGAGTFDETTKTLSWGEVNITAGREQSRTFVVQLLDPIPLTNTGTSDESSYDCRMTNTFGNTIEVNVECPQEKVVIEQTVAELPKTGPGENMIFAGTLLSVVVYFYARSRQLGKEVRLIRHNAVAGGI